MDYSTPKPAQSRKWKRTERAHFSFLPEKKGPMWDTLGSPRLPHRASRQSSMTYRRPIPFFGRADGQVRWPRPSYTELPCLGLDNWITFRESLKKTTGPAELRNNESRKYRMGEVHNKANDKKSALSLYWKREGSDWICNFHINLLVLDTKTALLT